MPTLIALCLVVVVSCAAPRVAGAQEQNRPVPAPASGVPSGAPSPGADRVTYDLGVDVPVTIAASAAWIVSELERKHLAPSTCRWCDTGPGGLNDLNALDAWGRRTLRWTDTGRAATSSSVTAYALTPAVAYGLSWMIAEKDGRAGDVPANVILITEAMTLASDTTQVVKFLAGRERPFVHVLPPEEKLRTASPSENNLSFPSGHTTFAFSLVAASAEIAHLRGYRHSNWIWMAGLPLATLTGYLRVAADKHYLTDVMAGAGIGLGVGWSVPYLGHRQKEDARVPSLRVGATSLGPVVGVVWSWE